MSLNKLCAILFVLAFVWVGAVPGASGQGPAYRPEQGRDGPTADRQNKVPYRVPTTSWQVVAVKSDRRSACPSIPGWTDVRLKSGKQRELDKEAAAYEDRELVSSGLDRYCTFVQDGGSPPVDRSKPFPQGRELRSFGLDRAEPDRMVLGAASPDDTESYANFAANFAAETAAGKVQLKGEKDTRVVYLDTEPTEPPAASANIKRTSLHGFAMMLLARDMLCSATAPCPIEIQSELVLPYKDYHDVLVEKDRDDVNGGRYGTLHDLALGIENAVRKWKLDKRRHHGYPKHLILNISAAWDGELYGGFGQLPRKILDVPARGVERALVYAKKSGALVIAAAGNRRGGSHTTLASLPAAWELWPPSWSLFLFNQKIVYAVGGVDRQGLPLANWREGGMPRRVAYGDHLATSDKAAGVHTGSSVSAATTSAIAAAVWHLRPELCARQVINLLSESSEQLPHRASFYFWRQIWPLSQLIPAPHLRRLTLCGAVTYAWKTAPSYWLSGLETLSSCTHEPPARRSQLAAGQTSKVGETPFSPYEEFLNVGAEPIDAPQPSEEPCPECGLQRVPTTAQQLRLSVALEPDPSGNPPVLSDPTVRLTCYDSGTGKTDYYSLGLAAGATLTSDNYDLNGPPAIPSLQGCTAGLAVDVDESFGRRSILIPLFIFPDP